MLSYYWNYQMAIEQIYMSGLNPSWKIIAKNKN